jgi:hypothetical protein
VSAIADRKLADITGFPLAELLEDREASINDIAVCSVALSCGVTEHRDGTSVQERLDINERILEAINDELSRRGVLVL